MNTDSTSPHRTRDVIEGDKHTGQLNLKFGTCLAGPHREGCKELSGERPGLALGTQK